MTVGIIYNNNKCAKICVKAILKATPHNYKNLSTWAYTHVFSANFAADCVKNACLVCNKIMLENPHANPMWTGSKMRC